MSASHHDEFYVGYQPTSPPGLAKRTRGTVTLLLLLGVAVAVTVILGQQPFARSNFEFLQFREFTGRLEAEPYPALLVSRPGTPDGVSRYHLVAVGKRGVAEEDLEWAGQLVRLSGSLVYRDDQTMIEVVSGSIEPWDGDVPAAGASVDLGQHSVIGEIVDSKCFLGVMNPGNLKVHRACATRCISGGIPPTLLVRDTSGQVAYLLLVGADGEAVNDQVLEMIAEPVQITGTIKRLAGQLVLEADPRTYRRLTDE